MATTLAKEVKDKLIAELSHAFGCVQLICDGRKVTLNVEQTDSLKYKIGTYVDGMFKGSWVIDESSPERKFLRVITKHAYSPAQKARFAKDLGKRALKKSEYMHRTYSLASPFWLSGRSAINHLCRVCDSIEVLPNRELSTETLLETIELANAGIAKAKAVLEG